MLRTIKDQSGETWEVVRGHESYGAMVILFCCTRDQRVMKSYIFADNALDADSEIDGLSDDELLQRLDEAEPGP
ncbi:hypothetical protein [Natronospira bacteriovora]|uniref:Uncharacterized protein n=1 Tax=Natronospira bacteriovora TaxID=3069753 RepID=A0ABU0W3V8_9GAMM|nr:hypothetical protein [Natronospira sp. AB-CW4]MDQ2068707.1 hypothetical protein [Natronospira sp. AB-CW4]